MRELSVAEQRYRAVLAVISDGETVMDVAARFGVARKTVHQRLARYEAGGLENLADRSHRPASCPHQMPVVVEVAVAELRQTHPGWGPQRLTVTSLETAVRKCFTGETREANRNAARAAYDMVSRTVHA
jgi:transposase